MPPAGTRPPLAEDRDRKIAAACILLLLIGMPLAYLPGGASTGDVIGMFAMIAVSLALTAFLILRLLPRERTLATARQGRTALILGVLALVTIAVFWTGIPLAFGAGAIALGLSVRESVDQSQRGQPTAAVVLGALGVVGAFVALLLG